MVNAHERELADGYCDHGSELAASQPALSPAGRLAAARIADHFIDSI